MIDSGYKNYRTSVDELFFFTTPKNVIQNSIYDGKYLSNSLCESL